MYYTGRKYLLMNDRKNLIFKDTYYEHVQMLECAFNLDEMDCPSMSATTKTRTKVERVTFRVAVLGRQKKFDVILKELREAGVSIPNDSGNMNSYLQPLYIVNVVKDKSCEMHAYALMKSHVFVEIF